MYLSKAKVSYRLIIESTQDHCPRKPPLLADQFLSTEGAWVVFLASAVELLVLQAARQKEAPVTARPARFGAGTSWGPRSLGGVSLPCPAALPSPRRLWPGEAPEIQH